MADILWLDNDELYVNFYAEALRKRGHSVKVVTNVSTAERALRNMSHNLLILDVMIPTQSEEEEEAYHPFDTESGLKTGLIFYLRNRDQLESDGTQLLVLTVRLDRSIFDQFTDAGLPSECFMTKMSLRETSVFLNKVNEILNRRTH